VASNYRYEVRFDNIVSDEEEYTITISTGEKYKFDLTFNDLLERKSDL